jgi:hypothetical protein
MAGEDRGIHGGRTMLELAKGLIKIWTKIKTDATSRVRWRILVEALCSAAV